MKIPTSYSEEMIAHARKEAPYECCGVIAGKNDEAVKLLPTQNAAGDENQYVVHPMDVRRIYRELTMRGWYILATYHSHPRTEAYPSEDDIRLAIYDVPYVIISLKDDEPVLRAFFIRDGAVTEEPVEFSL